MRLRRGMGTMLKRIVTKLTSGKFLLTVMMGVAFCYAAMTGKVTADNLMTVFLVVLYAYFNKKQ